MSAANVRPQPLTPRVLLWALGGALLLGAPPGLAEAPRFAVGKITARGGQGVRGVAGGVLLDRRFGDGCQLPEAKLKPAAATLGDGVELAIEMIGCPAGAKMPPVRCRARVGGEVAASRNPAPGSPLTVAVPLPDRTGAFDLEPQCEIDGQPAEPLTTRLYVTYARPRPFIDPPEAVWYERACDWGGGLRRTAPEQQVADQMLHRLYAFGQRQWRYALCHMAQSSSTTCSIPPEMSVVGLNCLGNPSCTSFWTDLVRGDSDRNFADCYVFTRVFQHMAATMGIGGMVDLQIFGEFDMGFLSLPKARSLDPAFTGNVSCGSGGPPCGYSFYNHDLRQWGGRIYDPTFGGIYQAISGLIAKSVIAQSNNGLIFHGAILCNNGSGYGNFPAFIEFPADQGGVCLAPVGSGDKPASFADTAPQLQTVPFDHGILKLAVTAEVDVLQSGNYQVSGGLYAQDGTPIVLRSDHDSSVSTTAAIAAPQAGTYPARLIFSGDDVRRSGNPGPYTLKAQLLTVPDQGPQSVLDTLSVALPQTLSPAELSSLGDGGAELGSKPELAWIDGGTVLQATLPVTILAGGTFATDARLSLGSQTLAYGGSTFGLPPGQSVLTVNFLFAGRPPAGGGMIDFALGLFRVDPPRTVAPVQMVASVAAKVRLPGRPPRKAAAAGARQRR